MLSLSFFLGCYVDTSHRVPITEECPRHFSQHGICFRHTQVFVLKAITMSRQHRVPSLIAKIEELCESGFASDRGSPIDFWTQVLSACRAMERSATYHQVQALIP